MNMPSYIRRAGHAGWCALVPASLVFLAACSTTPAPVAPQIAITTQELVGKWGLASYRVDTDRERTEKAARSACSNPYVITAGAAGGIMMYLADQSTASEVILKTAPDGRVYIGPPGKPGEQPDRLVLSYENGIMITQWVDPGVAKRYGTMVFVRCAAA